MAKTDNRQSGYAALISAILVSAILLVLAAPLARAAFWARFEVLERENEIMAQNFARACGDLALLAINRGQNPAWEKCRIVSKTDLGGGVWEIVVAADHKNSFVDFKIKAKVQNGQVEIIEYHEF